MVGWRIWYDDGTYSDDEITQPFRVICISQPNEGTGRDVLQSYSYYVLIDGVWRGVEDLPSVIQQFIYCAPRITAFVMGIWTDEDNYAAIKKRAIEDPTRFLPRSARHPDRRR